MDFYQGKVLRIDLSAGTSAVEPLNMEWAEKYIGGKGLLLRYMWEEIAPKSDPWAPENPVILMTGPFAGHQREHGVAPGGGLQEPGHRDPQRQLRGWLVRARDEVRGYDAIIITGESPEPVVVTIKDDVVSFVAAEPKYWGLKTSEIEEALRRDFDGSAKTLSIGPAGEQEVLWACLSTDQYHNASEWGEDRAAVRRHDETL